MIRIVTYEPQYKQDFIQLNKQWIETWFRLEQSDLDTFAHIDDNIIGYHLYTFLTFNCSTYLSHIAARDGERFVAVLDEQLGGARM